MAPTHRAAWHAPLVLILGISSQLLATPTAAQQATPFVTASLLYERAEFDVELEPWEHVTGEVQHRASRLSTVVRATMASRFDERGTQIGGDVYPRFSDDGYLRLGAAYSSARIFPTWRIGAELFRNLGDAFEVSAGARYMKFAVCPCGS